MRKQVHFLHLGKNAGTQFKYCAHQVNAFSPDVEFVLHPHRIKLHDLPAGSLYVFCIREPISRFSSGFYSRKRKGQPTGYSEWSSAEAQAFSTFEHANDLAEAIYRDDEQGQQAQHAMNCIGHVRAPQYGWFEEVPGFLETYPPVSILSQKTFDADMLTLCEKLDTKIMPVMAATSRSGRRFDYKGVPELSEVAVENLRKWYAADIEFVQKCEAWRAR